MAKSTLGKREKMILLTLLEHEMVKGQPDAVWFALYNKFQIHYTSNYKSAQPDPYREERRVKCALYRLTKRDLIRPSLNMHPGVSVGSLHRQGHAYYYLTRSGFEVVQKLRQEEQSKLQQRLDEACLEHALDQLRALGHEWITVKQVLETLWQTTQEKHATRTDFDNYWNRTKLGLLLKKYTVCHMRTDKNNRHYQYLLKKPQSHSSR